MEVEASEWEEDTPESVLVLYRSLHSAPAVFAHPGFPLVSFVSCCLVREGFHVSLLTGFSPHR